jgi:hypothetical protein
VEYVGYETVPHLGAVELCSVGMEWPANIPFTVTAEHLVDVVKAANDDPHIQVPRLKIGHSSEVDGQPGWIDPFEPLGDGAPALGRVINLRTANDGAVLLGDFIEVPSWLAEAMPSAYPSRSGEWRWDIQTPGGKRYTLICTAMALLGQRLPAVQDLEDLQRVLTEGPDLAAAAASNPDEEEDVPETIETSVSVSVVRDRFNFDWAMSEPIDGLDTYWWWARDVRVDPAEVIADDDEGNLWRIPFSTDGEDNVTFSDPVRVRETYVDIAPAGATAASLRPVYVTSERGATDQVQERRGQQILASFNEKPHKPEKTAASRPDDEEEDSMPDIDIPALRSRLDLSEDQLPDDASAEQINQALTAEAPPEEERPEGDPPEEEQPEEEREEQAAAASTSTRTLDEETYQRLLRGAETAEQLGTERARSRRETLVNAAVQDGRIAPARRDHWVAQLEADAGAEQVLSSLAPGTIPVDERGAAAEASESDENLNGLFPELAESKA